MVERASVKKSRLYSCNGFVFWTGLFSPYPKEAKQLLMAAELSHFLSVDEIKHKYEKTVKDIEMFYSGVQKS